MYPGTVPTLVVLFILGHVPGTRVPPEYPYTGTLVKTTLERGIYSIVKRGTGPSEGALLVTERRTGGFTGRLGRGTVWWYIATLDRPQPVHVVH